MAVCVYSIDIGEQLHKYTDKSSYQHDVVIGFELSGVSYEENGEKKPYDLSKTYNASKYPTSAFRKMVNAWNGREMSQEEADQFDTNDVVGRTAMVNVVLKENGYNDIQSVMQVPPGLPEPVATMPFIRFDMEPWDQQAFEALPEWAQNRIKKSTQYQKYHLPAETVTVQGAQQPQGAAFQMPQNIPGLNFQGAMQMPGAGAAVSQATVATGSFMQGSQPQQVVQQPVQAPQQVQGFMNTGAAPVQGGGVVPF